MEFQNYWYLLILFALAGLTMFLFLKKTIVFIMEIKYMLPAIIFSGAIFVLFNNRLFETGIIHFNINYLMGTKIYNLPVEEWLFLLIISLFAFSVYILVSVRFANLEKPNLFMGISVVLLLAFGFEAWSSRQKLVPFFIFFLLVIYFGYTLFRNRFKVHLAKFFISYLIVVVPFLIIRAIVNSLPVILYSNDYILGLRLFNMPVEEFAYLFLLMLINITIFEYLRDNQLY
jgi:lycopene cyclase domain-containing protein